MTIADAEYKPVPFGKPTKSESALSENKKFSISVSVHFELPIQRFSDSMLVFKGQRVSFWEFPFSLCNI